MNARAPRPGSEDCQRRLLDLADTPPGWLDGEGEPVTPEALDRAGAILAALEDRGVARPGVFPTPSGGVNLEYGYPGADVEIPPSADDPMEGFAEALDDIVPIGQVSAAVDFMIANTSAPGV
ncbi:hypothetical protein LG293_16310 (plasmid) [Citricoccus nitrophenolicus]